MFEVSTDSCDTLSKGNNNNKVSVSGTESISVLYDFDIKMTELSTQDRSYLVLET